MSSAMRGGYTLKTLAYGIHHKGVQLVEIFEAPSSYYVGKDRAHRTGLINLWPVSCDQLMDPRAV